MSRRYMGAKHGYSVTTPWCSAARGFRELNNFNTIAGAITEPEKQCKIISWVRVIIDVTKEINRNPDVAVEAQAMVSRLGGLYTVDECCSWPHIVFVASFAEDMLDRFVEETVWLVELEKRQARSLEELAPLIDWSVCEKAIAADR